MLAMSVSYVQACACLCAHVKQLHMHTYVCACTCAYTHTHIQYGHTKGHSVHPNVLQNAWPGLAPNAWNGCNYGLKQFGIFVDCIYNECLVFVEWLHVPVM